MTEYWKIDKLLSKLCQMACSIQWQYHDRTESNKLNMTFMALLPTFLNGSRHKYHSTPKIGRSIDGDRVWVGHDRTYSFLANAIRSSCAPNYLTKRQTFPPKIRLMRRSLFCLLSFRWLRHSWRWNQHRTTCRLWNNWVLNSELFTIHSLCKSWNGKLIIMSSLSINLSKYLFRREAFIFDFHRVEHCWYAGKIIKIQKKVWRTRTANRFDMMLSLCK